ncbi:MAG: hypothetical protein AB9872_00250 [Solidesulfovibrio sp.]
MFIKSIKLILIIVLGMLFGCGSSGSGGRSHFSRMNSQFLPDAHASWLWHLRNGCEKYKSGVPSRVDDCAIFEDAMEGRKKSCEAYKAGSTEGWADPVSCEILDVYEVKYKNMTAPVSTRPSSPGDGGVISPWYSAKGLWWGRIDCERYKAGGDASSASCDQFETNMQNKIKACEAHKASSQDGGPECEVLEIYRKEFADKPDHRPIAPAAPPQQYGK